MNLKEKLAQTRPPAYYKKIPRSMSNFRHQQKKPRPSTMWEVGQGNLDNLHLFCFTCSALLHTTLKPKNQARMGFERGVT